MQRLTTLFLLAGITFTAQAQTVDDYQPDSDGDGCIGMSDLLSLLSVFGTCEAWACGDPINYQGYDYATVLIGEQCWFAENLRSELYLNGDSIPANMSDSEWSTTTSGAVAVFGEGSSTCVGDAPFGDPCDEAWSLNEYGRLYNWYAVDDARSLCPSGWHVPTDGEWTMLENHVAEEWYDGGAKLKAISGWDNCGNGNNSSGFTALPGGYRHTNGIFWFAGGEANWWSSSEFNHEFNSGGRYRGLTDSTFDVWDGVRDYTEGLSVRCIQD